MAGWREMLLDWLLLGVLSLTAGAAIMIVHGLLMHRRLRAQSLGECITTNAIRLVAVSGLASLLLLTQAMTVPWDWLGTLALLMATAPALLVWLGPPEGHVEACGLCQIGRGSAYGHSYGYLRLMHGENSVRRRLGKFLSANPAGLSADERRAFRSDVVAVLAPTNGEYPSDSMDQLLGVGPKRCQLPYFECDVGGNRRRYGNFSVHEVTGSDNRKVFVALDKVGALATLLKLREHYPANFKTVDCTKQMKDLMDELEKIVANNCHLRGQLVVVRYDPGEHVGDAILTALES